MVDASYFVKLKSAVLFFPALFSCTVQGLAGNINYTKYSLFYKGTQSKNN